MPKHRKPNPTRRPAAYPPPKLEELTSWHTACAADAALAVFFEQDALTELLDAFEALNKRRKQARKAQRNLVLAREALRSWHLRAGVRPQVPSAAQDGEEVKE